MPIYPSSNNKTLSILFDYSVQHIEIKLNITFITLSIIQEGGKKTC